MSYTIKMQGFIAPLLKPLSEEDREFLSEHLYDTKTGLFINYEGTLDYSDIFAYEGYSVREDIYGLRIGTSPVDMRSFQEALEKSELEVDWGAVEEYTEIYYNGGDSCIDMLTFEDYRKRFNSIWGAD